MALLKPTRSSRRTQHHSNSRLQRKAGRLMKPVDRLPVYENLFALNRDFEQVLNDIARLQELGVLQRDLGHIFSVVVKETRAWANMETAEFLQMREQDAWAWVGRLHAREEQRLRDANDVLLEAKLLMEKRRFAAARKKSKRQGRSAGSKAI